MVHNRHVDELLFPCGAPAINGCGETEAPHRLARSIPEYSEADEVDREDLATGLEAAH